MENYCNDLLFWLALLLGCLIPYIAITWMKVKFLEAEYEYIKNIIKEK